MMGVFTQKLKNMNKRTRKPGGGRKPANGRRIDRNRSFYLYEDQVEQVTPDFVRQAVDQAIKQEQKSRPN